MVSVLWIIGTVLVTILVVVALMVLFCASVVAETIERWEKFDDGP